MWLAQRELGQKLDITGERADGLFMVSCFTAYKCLSITCALVIGRRLSIGPTTLLVRTYVLSMAVKEVFWLNIHIMFVKTCAVSKYLPTLAHLKDLIST